MSDEIARWATGTRGHRGEPCAVRVRWADLPDGQRWVRSDSRSRRRARHRCRRPGRPTASGSHTRSSEPGVAASWSRISRPALIAPVPGTQSGLNITPVFSPDGQDARVRALRRERHRHFFRERRRSLLCATLDRGTLCGQLVCNVFARRKAHRLRFHPCRTAADLRHGRRRDRSRAPGAVRFRRQRRIERAGVVPRRRERRFPPRS